MINWDGVTQENISKHNSNWPEIPDHLHKILIMGGSLEKTIALFNLISHQQLDIDKTYLYAKDPYEANYQLLTSKREV